MFRISHLGRPTALLALFLLGGMCPAFGAGFKQLHGHVPEATRHLTATGRLPATNELHLAIGVPLRDPAGLDKFLADVYDPASPNYRHFLTPAEFAAQFSATEADYAVVKNFALTNGFKISGEYGNRILLDVTAKAADVERAFHFHLLKFQHPTEAREFFAPDAEPTVDVALAVVDVQGLSDYSKPHPKFRNMDPNTVAPKNGSGPNVNGSATYIGNDFRNAYASGVALTGAGQMVGLFQLDGYYASDIAAYAQQAGGGRTNIQVQTVPVGSTNWSIGVNGGNTEVSLDIEMAMSMAPGLSKILVFEGPSSSWPNDVLNAMAASNTVKNLSSSWGWSGGPVTSTDNIFKNMAAQGQSFFNASGDSCAFTVGASSVNGVDNPNTNNAPSSSPYITQVGGTTLTMNGTGTSYSSETVWNWGSGQGSSGGVSSYYSIPSWQTNISMTANLGSTTNRNIPDVALTADNVYVAFGNGTFTNVGGTSCAAPLWAGFMALVNQQIAAVTGSSTNSAGFINPAIYAIGEGFNPSYTYAACFHDTTSGNNYWSSSPTNYPAVTGYDLCTGWGTPNGINLINALVGDTLIILPNSIINMTGTPGGPFSPSSQVFTLTNSSASPLNWSVINTSAWLNVSSSSGTLVTNSQTTVTISLNSAANSLAVGTYVATVGFTNQATHALQSRQFTLQVIDPLEFLTPSGFTAYGAVGGPFTPGSEVVVFTNLAATSLNWSIINTSSWLSVSASSGSVAGNSSTSVTVATDANTANLAAGIYSATLVLSNQASHQTQSLLFSASIGQNIVQNGGFETGDFTGWTQSGDTSYTGVISGNSSYVHSGTYGAQFGPSTSLGYIIQTLATSPGQTYLLSFWLSNPDLTTQSGSIQFQAIWNGTTLTNFTGTDPAADFNWKQFNFIVTATATSTALQFGFFNGPDYFGFDDVSVTPVNPPAITQQPFSQTNLVGSTVVFTATASGTPPLSFHWRTNGVNLANNAVVSGATTNVLTLTGISLTNAGNYTLVVTNAYGSITSSVAALTVVLPATITSSTLTNRAVECGANTNLFAITTAGTTPLGIQWKLDGNPIGGATNASFALTNLLSPSHTVTVTVTNLYSTVTSNATVTVQDTHPPVITLIGANPFYVELGNAYVEPGATAYDTCAGTLTVSVTGTVNTNAISTNTLFYTANDGNNSATNTRTVIVRDTTPPTILWSFTNLVLAAGTNTTVSMPTITGTNYILAADISGALTIMQNPAFKSALPLGTNAVLLTVADASGNAAYSTNRIIVAASTNATPKITSPVVQVGSITLQLSGGYGSTYVLEARTDFLSGTWLPLATNTIGISGIWQFTDTGATNAPARFYRLELVQ